MKALINELITEPDRIEKISAQIAGILAIELDNQWRMAKESGELHADDYNVHVYIENDEPFAVQESNPFPAVCVSFRDYAYDSGDAIENSIHRATFWIDCYASGNFDGEGFAGRVAKLKSMKLARFVRNILEAGMYRYLGLRKIVIAKKIQSQQSGELNIDSESAIKVAIQRIVLEVEYWEKSPQAKGVDFEGFNFLVKASTGEVLINYKE